MLKLQAKPFNINAIDVHALTVCCEDVEVEMLYQEILNGVKQKKADEMLFVILGAFNSTIVSSKFENQINKAITSCFYAVKPFAVYNTRIMLPSAKKIAFLPLKKVV